MRRACRERGRRAVTSFELRQRPHESYARLAWRAGKMHDDSSLSFTDDWWEKATPVDWSPEQKQGYLLALWDEVLTGIDRLAGSKRSRSAVIESVLRLYLKQRERARLHAHDLEILNRAAHRLNPEAEETLEYQADPWRPEME